MAIKNLAKAEALIRELKERLEIRTAGSGSGRVNTVREARDTEGYPALFLSRGANEAAGQPVLAIRIKQIDAVSKDVFGNGLNAYAPHVCEFAYETGQVDKKDIETAMFELVRNGVKIQVKEIAASTAVTFSSIDAATPALELDDLRWPTKGV
jgi:hypothetical protein